MIEQEALKPGQPDNGFMDSESLPPNLSGIPGFMLSRKHAVETYFARITKTGRRSGLLASRLPNALSFVSAPVSVWETSRFHLLLRGSGLEFDETGRRE
jgi:hypothetical protein